MSSISDADASAAAAPGRFAQEMATVRVLLYRDLVRFFRERTRIAGALIQPLIFWLVIGSGLSPTFVLPRARDVGYLEYFYPGIVIMVILFTAIFATMSVIEDRHSGFLRAVLVAPGSRASVVLGKALGASSVAMLQGTLFVLLAPLAGFGFGQIAWPLLIAALVLTALAFTSAGFAVAWVLDSTQGYHVVMSVLMLPMWILSGAMFPVPGGGWMSWVLKLNPMSYTVSVLRHGFYGAQLPEGTQVSALPITGQVGLLAAFSLLCVAWAIRVCYTRR